MDDDRSARDARWRTLHGDQVRTTFAAGDPEEIKRLYVEMGALLEDSYRDDVAGTPLLSLSETIPVVTDLLADASGLLLDAGCGPHPGVSIALVQSQPARTMIALDLGIGTVRLARARAATEHVSLIGVVGDIEALPFRSAAFGGVVSDDTIEHVPDDRRAIAEMLRVTERGAPVVIATPNRHSVAVLARKLRDTLRRRRQIDRSYFAAESHLREYTTRELDELIDGIASIERRSSVGWSGGVVRRLVSAATRTAVLRRFDRMLVVRLRAG